MIKTKRWIWTFYLIGIALFSGVLYAGLLSLDSIKYSAKIGLFIYTLGTSIIISKNLVDILIGEGSVKQNIQDIIITMVGFTFIFGSGLLSYFFFF